MKTPEYHVSAGIFGGIYAGTLMPKKDGKPQMWRNKSHPYCTVIGNIFDNPELLEEENHHV